LNGLIAFGYGTVARDSEVAHLPRGLVTPVDVAVENRLLPAGVEATWVRVRVHPDDAEQAQQAGLLLKGARVFFAGRCETRVWTSKADGKERRQVIVWAWRNWYVALDGMAFLPGLEEMLRAAYGAAPQVEGTWPETETSQQEPRADELAPWAAELLEGRR
jgi:Single-strand binding protein family